MFKQFTLAISIAFLFTGSSDAADAVQWVERPALTFDQEAGHWWASFEVDGATDVEVAIVDRKTGYTIRHLAAGVLGPKAPPPLKRDTLAQKLRWDGNDDYGHPFPDGSDLTVRVRAGMSVRLVQIVGGDPYAYFSKEIGHGDHSPFGINGLEVTPDGKAYVWGHSSNLGPPALREYDADGTYVRTLFPPPAGNDIETMKAWGINVREDGTYTPKFNRLTDPSLTTTFLDTHTGGMARMLPTPLDGRLSFWRTGNGAEAFDVMTINDDGTLAPPAEQPLSGKLVENPPLPLGPIEPNSHIQNALLGPIFTCCTEDGTSFYLSGAYAATARYGTIQQIKPDGFWRDGQVWKVDLATRTAKVVFALDESEIITDLKERTAALGGRNTYASLHGVAVDGQGHLFIADRLHKRIVVLDESGKRIREIPVEHPDAIAVSRRTGALYVTTRFGDEHARRGDVALLKFANWRKDDEPAFSQRLCPTGYTGHHKHSYVALHDGKASTNVWVAYTELPVQVYRDDSDGLRLVKDFYEVDGAQRCLGFDRMVVDPAGEEVYLLDDHASVWKVSDWEAPSFERVPLETSSLAIDARRRFALIRTLRDGSSSNSVGKVARFHLGEKDYAPADFGDTGTNRLTPSFHHEWCFTGNGDKGIAVAPNGNIAVVGDPEDGLRVYSGTDVKVPWDATVVSKLPHRAGGVQFDLAGNLYVGIVDAQSSAVPEGFEGDRFAGAMGRIHKFSPTGKLNSGNLFPKAPESPAQIYDVPLGAFDADCIIRTPRFAVDGFGRIYYPTNIAPRVTVIDNAGNEILHFGTYGNRDSLGGLEGDLVPTRGIPLAFPNSVAATDDYIYVADMVNVRLLRLRKEFAAEAVSR